jgi:SAM-dependent methyltransferase
LVKKQAVNPITRSDSSDRSNGYESIAREFMAARSPLIGVGTVREWARDLPPRAAVLDLGCGNGRPISQSLVDEGFAVYGVDASASMIAALRKQVPTVQAECCSIEDSAFFGRTFDGVVAWGLMFLLRPDVQSRLIGKVSRVLNAGGHFIFTAPQQACEWSDSLSGRRSVSLGLETYRKILAAEGLALAGERLDEGDNHYYLTSKKLN